MLILFFHVPKLIVSHKKKLLFAISAGICVYNNGHTR